MTSPILTLRGIGKRFGPVAALADIDLEVFPGGVQAVLGENGAGKSTLMRVIYGLVAPDTGMLQLDGQPVRFASALDARRAGIGMVHQEFALIDALSVGENLALSVCGGRGWLWQHAEVAARAQRLAQQIGLDLGDLDAPVGALPVGVRQRIEIVKALAGETRVLILDEPTAVLTPREVEQLFAVLERLRHAGTAILFITHKLGEVMAIADRIIVMRAGRIVARAQRHEVSEPQLARLMVGTLDDASEEGSEPPVDAAPRLELAHVGVTNGRGLHALADVSLTVRHGEIFGIAGVDGNGQAELFELLAGARVPQSGSVAIDGTVVHEFAPAAMNAAGIACVPPDRLRQGVVAALSIRENAVLNAELLSRLSSGLLRSPAAERTAAQSMVDAYAIKIGRLEDPVRSLSGGNMQKLVVARALALAPRVLVAANPTRGLDIAAARAVHAAFAAALARGAAVLLISTDLDEILAHAHRVAVLYRGRLSTAMDRSVAAQRIGALMAGSEAQA